MENHRPEAEETATNAHSKEAGHEPSGDAKWTSLVLGSESRKGIEHQTPTPAETEPSTNRTASRKSVHWSSELVTESSAMSSLHGSNSYASPSPVPSSSSFSFKDKMENVRNVLGRWGKKVGEATKKAEDLVGNTWQHYLKKLGGLDVVIQELNHGDPDIRRLAAWIIGKASQSNVVVQKQVLELGALAKLMKMVKSSSTE